MIEPLEMAQEFRKFEYSTPWESFPNFRPKEEEASETPVPQVESGDKKWTDVSISSKVIMKIFCVNKDIIIDFMLLF